MILKSLELKNIRSYKDRTTIDFPEGTCLFSGDIGSGKSSLLMAIEFALFGLGNQRGGSLLRTGESRGHVKLRFSANGKDYEVFRSLKRSKNATSQDKTYIKTERGKLKLSATEMKEKILNILGFREPASPRAKSVIYRYAVYTPQEEMKYILLVNEDKRLETFRQAFNLKKYETARDNAKTLFRVVEGKRRELEGEVKDLDSLKNDLKKIKKQKTGFKKELEENESKKEEKKEEVSEKKSELEGYREVEKKVALAQKEFERLKKSISDRDKRIIKINKDIKKVTREIEEKINPKIKKLEKITKPTSKSIDEIKTEIRGLREEEKGQLSDLKVIEDKIRQYKSVKEKKACPTCDRPADPSKFEDKIEAKKSERKGLEDILKKLREKISNLEELEEKLSEYMDAQRRIKDLIEKKEDKKSLIKGNKDLFTEQEKERKKEKEGLEENKKILEDNKGLTEKIKTLESEKEKLKQELKKLRNKVAKAKTNFENAKKEMKKYEEKIREKEQKKQTMESLKEYGDWIDQYFVPTLQNIEKHVMVNISQEFDSYFRRWFNFLVEDTTKHARIDEVFTPIVEQDGYQQEVGNLSGGEKSSVALSYRLALNHMVQKVSTGMTSNLLILDEPTDGFSKEQLYKVRDVLEELSTSQTIIVSHEPEVESFADQVYRVNKSDGVSSIER